MLQTSVSITRDAQPQNLPDSNRYWHLLLTNPFITRYNPSTPEVLPKIETANTNGSYCKDCLGEIGRDVPIARVVVKQPGENGAQHLYESL